MLTNAIAHVGMRVTIPGYSRGVMRVTEVLTRPIGDRGILRIKCEGPGGPWQVGQETYYFTDLCEPLEDYGELVMGEDRGR